MEDEDFKPDPGAQSDEDDAYVPGADADEDEEMPDREAPYFAWLIPHRQGHQGEEAPGQVRPARRRPLD